MKKSLIALLFLLLGSLSVEARPAYPGKRTVTLADGRQVVLTYRGDEHFSFFTDEDGLAYRRVAHKGFEQISWEEVNSIWEPRLARANKARQTKRIGTPKGELTGTRKGLVILMQFADYAFVTENAKSVYQDYFNKSGYTDYGMTGSVKDYFKAQSYGTFELDFDVVGPYTAGHSMVYYGGHSGNANDSNPAELIKEGCELADEEVNFTDYDWDGDGEVDQVFVVFAGYGENYDNTEDNLFANCLWPHESQLKSWRINLKLDGVTINTYACNSELSGIEGTEIDGIGGACHEFSHCLGLPDFYDTAGDNFGMAVWDVMDQGNYNNNSRTPAGYTSYERMFAGWLKPTELNTMTRVEGMKPLTEAPEAYILYNDANKNEYYLLENRQLTGFDAGLYGHGLLVLHVDYDKESWESNRVNVSSNHQRLTIIPADNELKYTTSSLAGDPFPSKKGITELTNYSTPAATLFNANTDGSKLMSKPIDNIKESDKGLISFVACRPEMDIPEIGDGEAIEGEASFTIGWSTVSNAIGYELEVTEIGTASDNPADALENEYTFDKLVSKATGFSDISKKMTDYDLKGWTGSKLFTSPNKLKIGTSSAAGYVQTETWKVPQSSEITVVMGVDVFKAGTPVKGKVRLAYGNKGDNATYEDQEFEITENGLLIFHFQVFKTFFWLEIRPESQMYLNYLAIYDGDWTAEQLGINAKARQQAPRKATTKQVYTTETNSYTLKNVNPRSRFICRVRAIGEENQYSLWSAEKIFAFDGSVVVDYVSAGDIVETVNYMLGKTSASFDKKKVDKNNDDKVNIADIIIMVSTILGN